MNKGVFVNVKHQYDDKKNNRTQERMWAENFIPKMQMEKKCKTGKT